MGFFGFLPGIGGVLDSVLSGGATDQLRGAQRRYDEAVKAAQGQIKTAQDTSSAAYGEAKGYRDQAGGMYSNISNWAAGDRDAYQSLLNTILGEYGTTAGISSPLTYTPAKAPATAPNNRTTPRTGGAAAMLNSRTIAPATYDPRTMPGPAPAAPAKADPYGLTLAQETQINQQTDAINRQKQTAIENVKARYAQAGITDPRAMQAAIQDIEEQYGSAASGNRANFAESARENREQSLASLVDFFSSLMQQATGNYAGAAGGLQSVGGQAQNVGDVQSGQATSLLGHQLSGADQNVQQAQQAVNQYDADMAALLGLVLTGGLSTPSLALSAAKPSKTKQTTSQAVVPYVPGITSPEDYNLFPWFTP